MARGAQETGKKIVPGPRDDRGVLAARILEVARHSFAENGYAGTTVRAVAREADVDPALVYHYYGSKQALLDAATTPPQSFVDKIARAWAQREDDLADHLVRQMLANWEDPEHAAVLQSIMQIAGNEPATREKLKFIIENSVIGPSGLLMDEEERLLRSTLIATQFMGLAFMRFVWKIDPIASLDTDQIVVAIAPTIRRYLEGNITS